MVRKYMGLFGNVGKKYELCRKKKKYGVESFADATKSAIQIADLNDYKIDIYHTIHFPYLLFF